MNVDDWIDGKSMEKGMMIIMNVWGLHHKESIYLNPDIFDLERYAGQTHLAAEYAGPQTMKSDLGEGSAREFTWQSAISFSGSPSYCGRSPNIDAQGREIPVDANSDTGYTEGFLVSPKPFDCRIGPRSEARRETIMRECSDAETKVFSKYEV